MKKIIMILAFTLALVVPSWAGDIGRFQSEGRVILEKYPEQTDVMRVFLRPGFATKLEFEEDIALTVNGNKSMMSLIESKDKKSIIVYPRQSTGVTNLLVDTLKRKLNYEIVIGDKEILDYRIRGNESIRNGNHREENIPFGHLIRLASNYTTLKDLGILSDEEFTDKKLYKVYDNHAVTIVLRRILSYRNPHYLFFDLEIINATDKEIKINDKHSVVLVNGKEFIPEFTALYDSSLLSNERTNGWIVLEHTRLSMENTFNFSLEINNENRLFE